jgi:hypothetical protein
MTRTVASRPRGKPVIPEGWREWLRARTAADWTAAGLALAGLTAVAVLAGTGHGVPQWLILLTTASAFLAVGRLLPDRGSLVFMLVTALAAAVLAAFDRWLLAVVAFTCTALMAAYLITRPKGGGK